MGRVVEVQIAGVVGKAVEFKLLEQQSTKVTCL